MPKISIPPLPQRVELLTKMRESLVKSNKAVLEVQSLILDNEAEERGLPIADDEDLTFSGFSVDNLPRAAREPSPSAPLFIPGELTALNSEFAFAAKTLSLTWIITS